MRAWVVGALLAGAGCASGARPMPPGRAGQGPVHGAAGRDAVPAGTLAGAELHQPLSTWASRDGDRFTLELLDPLVDVAGRARVGRGAVVEGRVERTAGGPLGLRVLGVRGPGGLEPLPAEVVGAGLEPTGQWGAGLVGGLAGAAAGTGAGLAIDADRGAVVAGSAVIGAALGALVGWWVGGGDAELPAGRVVTLRLVDDARPPVEVPGPPP